jgi:hypothetical protein
LRPVRPIRLIFISNSCSLLMNLRKEKSDDTVNLKGETPCLSRRAARYHFILPVGGWDGSGADAVLQRQASAPPILQTREYTRRAPRKKPNAGDRSQMFGG